jgi:ABC-type branched-subunit amino acid transport system substrate-binding protein
MVESEAIYPEEYNLPTSYLTTGGADYQVAGTPLLAHDLLGAKTFAYVGQDIPFSKAYHGRIKIVADQLGMEEVSTIYLPLDAANFDSYAAKLAKAKPDVILMITSPFQNIPLIKTIEGQGYRPTYILNGDVPRNDDFKNYGSAADRIYVVGDVPPLSSADQNTQLAEYVKQLEAYRKKSGDTEGTGVGDSRISSTRVWLAMQFIKQLLEEQDGEITASSLVKSLDAAKDLKSEMIPPWTPSSEGCFKEFARVSNPSVRFLKIENGELVEADPDTHNVNDYLCK